jgi:pyridoxamine 5'-phosphate oxidase-like protein
MVAMNWAQFAKASPELAALGRQRFEARELCMLGTLRANGWPRISPCELDFVAEELLLGMMWQSPKARDLLRDDRCVLHSCTSNKDGTEGDFKLYGRARDEHDRAVHDAYRAAVRKRIDWEPTGSFHLFAIEVDSAGFVVFSPESYAMAWDPARGTRRWNQRLE